jgi:IPT/TIG domain
MRGGRAPHQAATVPRTVPCRAAKAVPAAALSAAAALAVAAGALLAAAAHAPAPGVAPRSYVPSAPRFAATLSAQALQVRFTRAGAQLHAGTTSLSLRLAAVRDGGTTETLAPVAPITAPRATEYVRPAISEWYVKRAHGLEQGFTVARPPRAHAVAARLDLGVAVGGNARLSISRSGASVLLGGPRGVRLRYGQLRASDASGRELPSRLSLRAGEIVIGIDTAGARYPLRIDPYVQLQPMILPGGEESVAGALGTTLAISGDGDTAVAGATRNDGAAFVFARPEASAAWARQGVKLVGVRENHRETQHLCTDELLEPSGCGFGASIALSSDANTALIGSPLEQAPCETGQCPLQGAAFVFTRSPGGVWAEQQRIVVGTAEESPGGRFGRAVALSADGNTALIGAPDSRGSAGAAWVFTRAGGHWSQQGPELVASSEAGPGHFGYAVALSADGASALIGAPADASDLGSAWSFTRSGEAWTPSGKLAAGAAESGPGHFGFSVALSAAGELGVVGGPASAANRGGAWSFAHTGAGWGGPETLTPLNRVDKAEFGYAVALAAHSSTALVGGPGDRLGKGAAWAFARVGAGWAGFSQKLTAPQAEEASNAGFGTSVGLSADGASALIGGPSEDDGNGVLWAFQRSGEGGGGGGQGPPPEVRSVKPREGPSGGGTVVTVIGANLAQATAVTFGGAPAVAETSSNEKLTVIAPPHAPGVVDVVVTANGSVSALNAHDQFTYTGEGGQPAPAPESPPQPPGSGAGTPSLSALPFGPSAAPAHCAASAPAKSITVNSKNRAVVKLVLGGLGTCRGRVSLAIRKAIAHHRAKLVTIASVSFSLPAGRTVSLSLALNKLGRSLLHAGHGKLNARLTVLKLSPAPAFARSASVRLGVAHKSTAKH